MVWEARSLIALPEIRPDRGDAEVLRTFVRSRVLSLSCVVSIVARKSSKLLLIDKHAAVVSQVLVAELTGVWFVLVCTPPLNISMEVYASGCYQ